jgi:CDP-6-deoxy-D-xylo-4-hexulose-3-dehydrase
LPAGYDHKYTYRHLGYNLKPLDCQAAIGIQQLKKLDGFNAARRTNWRMLRAGMDDLSHLFQFTLPTHAIEWNFDGLKWDNSGHTCDPAWFGFALQVRDGAPFSRNELAQFLTSRKVGNRMLFGGNLVRQPAFVSLKRENPGAFRVVGNLTGADAIMNNCVFIGCYAGLTVEMINYMVDSVHDFTRKF